MEAQKKLLARQTELCDGLVDNKPPVEEHSLNSTEVMTTLEEHQNVDGVAIQAIVDGIKGYKAMIRRPEASAQDVAPCSVGSPGFSPSLEKDFTTQGPRGNLDCPFSKPPLPIFQAMADNNAKEDEPKVLMDICGHDDLDPIRLELEQRRNSNTPSGPSVGSTGSCAVLCPIRFLDKHTPEEVAEFVERHKHDIPRSHAACIARYQDDPAKMRQMDMKYGDLTNLVHELSSKHLPYLPDCASLPKCEDAVAPTLNTTSSELVLKWTENVDQANTDLANTHPAVAVTSTNPGSPVEDDNRQSRFDRPLRPVRVGESPSRPWGITVPFAPESTEPESPSQAAAIMSTDSDAIGPLEQAAPEASASQAEKLPKAMVPEDTDSPLAEKATPDVRTNTAGGCPFGFGASASQVKKLAMAMAMTLENTDSLTGVGKEVTGATSSHDTGSAGCAGDHPAADGNIEGSAAKEDIAGPTAEDNIEAPPAENNVEGPAAGDNTGGSANTPFTGSHTYNGPINYDGPITYYGPNTFNGPVIHKGGVNGPIFHNVTAHDPFFNYNQCAGGYENQSAYEQQGDHENQGAQEQQGVHENRGAYEQQDVHENPRAHEQQGGHDNPGFYDNQGVYGNHVNHDAH